MNQWGYNGVEYSGGVETDSQGFANLPVYASWNDWRVADYAKLPFPEAGIRVASASNNLVLRQYKSPTITSLSASTIAPGSTMRINGSNLDQTGASWQGRVELVPEFDNPEVQGINLPILSRAQNSIEVGIPGYLSNGRYKIRIGGSPNLYSPVFNLNGFGSLSVAKLGEEKLSYFSTNLVAGYAVQPNLVLSNQVTSSQYWMRNLTAINRNTVIVEKFDYVDALPPGSYGIWLGVSGLSTNWSQTILGPFGTLNWP
jgi:hypothetical protein